MRNRKRLQTLKKKFMHFGSQISMKVDKVRLFAKRHNSTSSNCPILVIASTKFANLVYKELMKKLEAKHTFSKANTHIE